MAELEDKNKYPKNVASFVLGIISILTAAFWYLTLPTGILAIIFGAKGTKRTGSKMAKAGLIMGIIGLAFFAFMYLGLIAILILASIY